MQETKTNEFNKIFDTSRKNLLDMGLRNNLLNFKEVKRTIPIIDEDIGELYNILFVDENSMEFLPKPKKTQIETHIHWKIKVIDLMKNMLIVENMLI